MTFSYNILRGRKGGDLCSVDSELEFRRPAGENESAVVNIYNVSRPAGCRRDSLWGRDGHVDYAICNLFAVDKNVGLEVRARWLAEGKFHPLRQNGGRGPATDSGRQCGLVDSRRGRAVQKIPQTAGTIVVDRVFQTGIQDLHAIGCIPSQSVIRGSRTGSNRRVGRQPDLHLLDLTRTEPREDNGLVSSRGECGARTNGRQIDENLLLVEGGKRHGIHVRVHVHTVGETHAAVHHAQLLNLEIRRVEARRDRRVARHEARDGRRPEARRRQKLCRNLHLLRQEVRRKRQLEFVLTRRTPNRDRDVGILGHREVSGDLALRAGEGQERVTLGLGAAETQIPREQLVSRQEVLGTPADTERNLLNRLVAPTTLQRAGTRLCADGRGVVTKNNHAVAHALVRRNGQDGHTGIRVGEGLAVSGVVLDWDALLAAIAIIRVVEVKGFADA